MFKIINQDCKFAKLTYNQKFILNSPRGLYGGGWLCGCDDVNNFFGTYIIQKKNYRLLVEPPNI